MFENLMLGSPQWLWLAVIIGAIELAAVAVAYARTSATVAFRLAAGLLKATGILLLVFFLLEPLVTSSRPRPGANLMVMLADDSQSLRIKDRGEDASRGEQMAARLAADAAWQSRLGQDFDLRQYVFGSRLESVSGYDRLTFAEPGSSLSQTLETLADRFRSRPVAGVLLFTDGLATDLGANQLARLRNAGLPPIYPVLVGSEEPLKDIRLTRVHVSQTNFEASPVTIQAEAMASGYRQQDVVCQVLNEQGEEVAREVLPVQGDDKPLAFRFQLRPPIGAWQFYQVRVSAATELAQFSEPLTSREATLENNQRLVAVDRGGGPYRVLYVSGRPNWEFKFLRRAIEEDLETHLVGLVRIARREPKFDYRSRAEESTNPLFRGFGNQHDVAAEQYDEPVLLRLGTRDKEELKEGFPQTADELFQYHAIILDDVEAEFFSADQLSLLRDFVSKRGGGFLMTGGIDSLALGNYQDTTMNSLLPVYLARGTREPAGPFKLKLTRDGWLQPWIRVRSTEDDERKRLNEMPPFQTLNAIREIKPGASILAEVEDQSGTAIPAIVTQRFGKGRSAAVMIGDLWRWGMHRPEDAPKDLEKAWRQTVRWLVAEVPARVDVTASQADATSGKVTLRVTGRTEEFEPLDNAAVDVTVTLPDGDLIELAAEPSGDQSGVYETTFMPRQSGSFRAEVKVTAADGSDVGQRETGWVFQPAVEEFKALTPDRKLLREISAMTEGEVLEMNELDAFVRSLPNRKIPITEPAVNPLWHTPWMFFLAIGCLIAEWGLRRWRGLP